MANKILLRRETPIIFRTGAGNKNFSIASLGNGTGFCSERVDLGAGSTNYQFEWRAYFELGSTVSGIDGSQTLDVFLLTYDGTHADGMFTSSTEGSISDTNKRFNLKPIGNVVVDTTTGVTLSASGRCEIIARYFHVVLFNFSGTSLSATQANNGIDFTPLSEEIQ